MKVSQGGTQRSRGGTNRVGDRSYSLSAGHPASPPAGETAGLRLGMVDAGQGGEGCPSKSPAPGEDGPSDHMLLCDIMAGDLWGPAGWVQGDRHRP